MIITAKSHDCEDIPLNHTHSEAHSIELFQHKNVFMYSVFNRCLLRDMGKTINRKHIQAMNAQLVGT